MQDFKVGLKQRLYNWTLRTARLERGLTPRDLAELIGYSRITIYAVENFRIYPSEKLANALCAELGLNKNTVFPHWLRDIKFIEAPEIAEDKVISLSEVSVNRLLNSERFMVKGWEEDIERKIDLERDMSKVMSFLTPREEFVIKQRFGLSGGDAKTLKELGKDFCVNAERIRQIENKALRKLRHPTISKPLKDYL